MQPNLSAGTLCPAFFSFLFFFFNTKQGAPNKHLLTITKRHKLKWHGHVSCSSGLAKTILQGTVKGGRRQCRQTKGWEDSIREWTGLESTTAVGSGELRKMEETGCEIVCDAQTTCVFWGQVKLKARDLRLPHWFAFTKAKQVSCKTVQAVVGLGEVLPMWLLWSKNKKQN